MLSFQQLIDLANKEIDKIQKVTRLDAHNFEELRDILLALSNRNKQGVATAVREAEDRVHKLYFRHPEDRPGI